MYKFNQDVQSLATGKDYKKGQMVPPDFNVSQFMIDKKVLVKVKEPKKDKEEIPAETKIDKDDQE